MRANRKLRLRPWSSHQALEGPLLPQLLLVHCQIRPLVTRHHQKESWQLSQQVQSRRHMSVMYRYHSALVAPHRWTCQAWNEGARKMQLQRLSRGTGYIIFPRHPHSGRLRKSSKTQWNICARSLLRVQNMAYVKSFLRTVGTLPSPSTQRCVLAKT